MVRKWILKLFDYLHTSKSTYLILFQNTHNYMHYKNEVCLETIEVSAIYIWIPCNLDMNLKSKMLLILIVPLYWIMLRFTFKVNGMIFASYPTIIYNFSTCINSQMIWKKYHIHEDYFIDIFDNINIIVQQIKTLVFKIIILILCTKS